MKKLIVFATLALGAFIFSTNPIYSQATTTVNIEINGFIHIHLNSEAAGGVVNFTYSSPEHYNTDQKISVANSLIVSASEAFDIKVKSNVANFTFGQNNIPVDALRIKAVNGGSLNGIHREVTLSQNNQTLVENSPRGNDLSLNLEYTIPRDKSSNFLGKPAGTYTGTVTYTATAR